MKIKSKIKRILSGVMAVCMSLTVASGILPEQIPGVSTVALAYSNDPTDGHEHDNELMAEFEPANQRYVIHKQCKLCGLDKTEIEMARVLVAPYIGYYDGKPHGITFELPTNVENVERGPHVITRGDNGGRFYKANIYDDYTSTPVTYTEPGYYVVYWKSWFDLMYPGLDNQYHAGYVEGTSYILILANQYDDETVGGSGGGTGGGSGSGGSSGGSGGGTSGGSGSSGTGGNGGNGGAGGSSSSLSALEQLHNEGTHTEDMYHFHHTEPATCERDGFDVFECRFCGKTISRNTYPKVGHSYDTYIVKEATCDDEGIIAHECTWCRDTNTETIPATGHSYKATVTPATCKTGLQITKYTCTKCGDQYEDSEIVDVPHTWATETIKADCTTAGEIHYYCKVCDASYVEKTSDALGHDWDEGHEFSAADGTNPAKWEYTCKRCGVKRYSDAASVSGCLAGNHTYEMVDTVKPTCTDLGYEWWECSGCGKREKRNYAPATKHDYREELKIDATCTTQGSTLYKCFNCGDTYSVTAPKLAHELVSVTTPATCQSPSVTVTKCENCKYTVRTEGTEKGNHIWRTEVDAATCTDEGIIKTICEVCGKEQIQESSKALGHDWDNGHIVEAGTCTTPATIELYCNRCPEIKKLSASELTSSALFSSASAAGGHNPGKPATCTEPQTCDDCGIVLNVATGHSYGEGAVIKEATCTQMGIMKYTCDKCGNSYEVNIPTTGKHTPGDEATCAAPQKCKDCGAILVEKLGHDWNEGADISSATCGASGVKEYTCRRCFATEKRNTSTTTVGHRAGASATCTTPQTCLDCGAVLAQETGHNWGSPVTLVKATCSTPGLVQYQCSKCNMTRQENTPADASLHKRGASATCTSPQKCTECGVVLEIPTGHSFNSGKIVIPATCTANAVVEYKCTGCGLTQREILADSAKRHTPGKAATCEEAQKCKDCGVVLEDKIDHVYKEVVTNPTCTEMGYTTYTCTVCGESHKSDYTDTLPHNYVEKVTEPTCTDYGYTTYTCHDCKDSYVSDYTKPKPHDYVAEVTPPTCTSMGFTTYNCKNCDATYKGDYVNATEHNYEKKVIPPTCEELGYTIYTCPDCGKEYMGDYEEVADHNFEANVIPPTCTESGYTVYTCKDCEYSYKSDYTDPKGHDYKKEVTPPTCTDMGYTTFTCNVCGHIEQGEYVNETGHKYVEKVTEPTCSEMGYTTFTCSVCGDSYVGNEVMPLPHDYTEKVTPPTCEDLGYTTYTCSKCGDTYDGNYIEATGHILSGWIIDTPATIESAGEKHIECTVCGKIITRAAIPQLIDTDNSDEDGKSTVGDYSIIITDKNGKPVFDSEIAIDTADNITIKLPEGRLLDYEDRTTITVTRTDTKEAVPGLQLFVSDANGNSSIGETDGNGQLVVPNGNSSTGDNNGTVGGGDTENSFTYVVTVTDKNNMVIPNCVVSVGENNGISVKLPYDVPMDYSNRITVTVTDQNRNGLNGIPVSVIGKDKTESGVTNVYGRLTVPNGNQDYTDSDGHANVNAYVVTVNDETKPLANSLVTYTEGANILVTLPETNSITFENRVTVTVLTKDGKPVRNMNVAVSDFMGNNRSGITDEKGQIVVPPLNEDLTDTDGNAAVDDLTVIVEDANAKIANALVTHADGKVLVLLPEANKISYENRITVTVLKGDEPVVGKAVIVSDTANNSDKGVTNTKGQVVIPPLDDDYTDEIGTARVNKYIVTVNDEKGFIENALVKFADEKISVTLPDTNTLTTSNQTTVTITDTDAKAVKGMNVTITDKNKKTASADTDANGKVTLPKKSSGGGGGGSSSGGGSHGGGGGGGSTVTVTYNVKVTDKDGKSVSVTKSVKDSKITLTLPSGKTLDGDNYYTILVTDKNNKPAPDIDITLKDKNGKTANGVTDANGKLVLPATEHKAYVSGYEDGSFRPDGNMTRAEAAAIFARNISDRKGESILNKKTAFVDVDTNAWYNSFVSYLESYNIIVGYDDGSFRPDAQITRAEFVTMCMRFYGMFDTVKTSAKNIFADVPASHWAASNICNAIAMNWIVGYADGTFKPDSNITRAEVVTIVNRVTERAADTEYVNKNLSMLNRFTDLTDKGYWAYYEITEAGNTHMAVDKANSETWVK